MKEDIIQTAVRKGIIPFALATFLLSGCRNVNEPYNNSAKKYETEYETNDYEADFVSNEKKNLIIEGTTVFKEIIGQTEMQIILCDNTYYLKLMAIPTYHTEIYTITKNEFMSLQNEYQIYKKNLNKDNIYIAGYIMSENRNNFEFSIKMPEIKTKASICQEINYSSNNNIYPENYQEYINYILETASTGEITKRFSINPYTYDEHLEFYAEQVRKKAYSTEYPIPQYLDTKYYIISIINEQKIVISAISGKLNIEETKKTSDVSKITNFRDNKITTMYEPFTVGGKEIYTFYLETGIITRHYYNKETEILSFNPNTGEAITKDNRIIIAPKNYKEYLYHDFNIAFTTSPDEQEIYMFVFNRNVGKALWYQKVDPTIKEYLESQIGRETKQSEFDLDDNDLETLIAFQVPENNYSYENYISFKEIILKALEEEQKKSQATITETAFEVEIISKDKLFSIGQKVSNASQYFYYKMNDGTYSLELRIKEDQNEIWYIGPELSWTIIDNGIETLKFRDNLNDKGLIDIDSFDLKQGVIILNNNGETKIFPGLKTDNTKLIRGK